MKCNCEKCGGKGTVTCSACDGDGWFNLSVEHLPYLDGHRHAAELKMLKQDAMRLKKQCERLCELNPPRAETYKSQLIDAMKLVEAKAFELYKDR